MQKRVIIGRLIFAGIVLVLFAFMAFYLFQKQKIKLNFLSFKIENAENSFIVPDIDRLVDKLNSSDDLNMGPWHPELKQAVDEAIGKKNFSFNREFSKECFISFNAVDFTVVFKTTSSLSALGEVISEQFGIKVTTGSGKVTLGKTSLNAEHFGAYLAISSGEISPKRTEEKLSYGNADYLIFNDEDQNGVRHILSKKYHFRLWQKADLSIKGRPVNHSTYFWSAPADFDETVFYGSNRITEDVAQLFVSPDPSSFDWLLDGLLYLRKGEHELLIAKQGDSRDLSLMLEEQTLEPLGDSASINHFNIGKFKVLPFETSFNWKESIPELKEQPSFYTEFKNFNVLSNSIPAMRWYLGQVQLGNLLENNDAVRNTYADCLPERAHYIRMTKDEESGYLCESRIYQMDSSCLFSEVTSQVQSVQMEGVEIVEDFTVSIMPDKLTAINEGGKSFILLNNKTEVTLYSTSGEKQWQLALSTPLVEDPQAVDFDNDGKHEYVFFQADQVDVVNSKGKSLNGFPVQLNGSCKAGLAVNYDNKFKWRLIVNVGNTVKVLSEEGKNVEGWMFNGMSAPINSKIYHVITKGKDIITFKDGNSVQHVLNRRGEYRLTRDVKFSLHAETDFVVGSLESALRKMGYKDGYIYNYYILDGMKDSVKIDQNVSPIRTFWKYNHGEPMLILEEPGRLLIVNQFGYVQSEVLKPNQSNSEFVGLVGDKDYGFVFADNTQNTIYLLNNYGKMILPQAVEGSAVSIIENDLLYTFSGINIKAYKIAD